MSARRTSARRRPASPSRPVAGSSAWRPSDLVEVRPTRHRGLGVFARRPIGIGDLIERAPVLVVPSSEASACPSLGPYCFVWDDEHVALTLGCGSLYNHSYEPNAEYEDGPAVTKSFIALRDIAEGEEITVNYNGDPDDGGPVGFEVR